MQAEAEKERVIAELHEAIANLDALTGLLIICASCKKIHAANGSWQQIESYIRDRSEVEFTHTVCPECALIWYPDHFQKYSQQITLFSLPALPAPPLLFSSLPP